MLTKVALWVKNRERIGFLWKRLRDDGVVVFFIFSILPSFGKK